MKTKSDLILNENNLIKTIFKLAFPIMICNMIKSLHDMVDMFFIGKMDISNMADGEAILSAQRLAISFTAPVFSIFQALAMGFMVAGVAIMSQYIGGNNRDKAKKVSGQLLTICIGIGVLFNILLFFLAPVIMKLMGAEVGTYKYIYSVQYIQIRSFEMVGLFIFYAYQATRQADGDTFTPVVVNSISIVVNIILTGISIMVLKMDITGAAIATVIGQIIGMLLGLVIILKNRIICFRELLNIRIENYLI